MLTSFKVLLVMFVLLVARQCVAKGVHETLFVADDAEGFAQYGRAVAIYKEKIVIAQQGDTGATSAGGVYVYYELGLGNYNFIQQLSYSGIESYPKFGENVDIEDTTIVVGASGDEKVYVFGELVPETWTEQSIVLPDLPVSGTYGLGLALSGKTLVVGEFYSGNRAHVFVETSPYTYTETQVITSTDATSLSWWGSSLALKGRTLVVASRLSDQGGFDKAGAAYVYANTTLGSYTITATLTASDKAANAHFGQHVATTGDIIVVVSSPTNAYLDYRNGAAYLFSETSPDNWVEFSVLTGSDSAGDNFGGSRYARPAIAIDRPYMVVGAPKTASSSGSIFVFHEETPGVWVNVDEFLATDAFQDSQLGGALALRNLTIVAGARTADGSTGKAYVFKWDPVDDCIGHACEHGATCSDEYKHYVCHCPPAYGGEFCSDCLCENGGVCHDDPDTGVGYCDCSDINYSGDVCDKDCNNGVGETYPDKKCNCTLSGATGTICNKDVNDCDSSPCANNGICTDYGSDLFPNHNNEFNCSCDGTGYHGVTCEISDCGSSPCLNDGMCEQLYDLDGPIGIQCNCSDTPYEGDLCQTEVDECTSSPCLNDGVCIDLLGDFTCNCAGTGYEGKTCSDDVDDCLSSPCQNDGACEDKGANKFKCTCNEFWEGDTCSEDVDDCILKGYYCENGAACTDDPVNMGDVMCTCVVEDGGFTGKYCNVPIEDACVTFNPCFNGGKCIVDDITKAITCDCRDTGYEGDICDVQVYFSECLSSPCMNGGQCYDPSDYQDDWYCVCDDTNGYFGDVCEFTACDSMPCQNSGTCIDVLGGDYTCTCAENYSGPQCEVDENEQVGAGSSSSSSSESPGDPAPGDDTTENESDGGMLIIMIVIVFVVFGAFAAGFFFYKKSQAKGQFVMPT